MEYLVSMLGLLARFVGDGGHGGQLWVIPVVLIVGAILAFLFIVVVFLLVRSFYRSEIAPRKPLQATSLEILKHRYAAGEISSEEFEKIKQDLGET
jgi:putative membrane protein